jgi:lambda repressor-like predicted transcriptional regulator
MARSRITIEVADEIRGLRRAGATMTELARRYGLTPSSLRDLVHGRTCVRTLRVELSAAAYATVERWARTVRVEPADFARELLEHAAQ